MDLLNIHTALRYACSQDPGELKAGEQQLKAWEKDKGYYAGLAVRDTMSNVIYTQLTTIMAN